MRHDPGIAAPVSGHVRKDREIPGVKWDVGAPGAQPESDERDADQEELDNLPSGCGLGFGREHILDVSSNRGSLEQLGRDDAGIAGR